MFIVVLILFSAVTFSSPAFAAGDEIRLAYEAQAHKAIQQADYEAALNFAQQAFDTLENPDNIEAWESRNLLAQAHEKLENKEEFLDHINWLIKRAKNQRIKINLATRKQRFLKKLASRA